MFQTTDDNPKEKEKIRSRTNQSLKKNLSNTKKKYGITVKLRKRTYKKKIKCLCNRGNLEENYRLQK